MSAGRLACLAACMLLLGPGSAQEVDLQVHAPDTVEFGDAFEVTVVRTWSAELEPETWDPAPLTSLGAEPGEPVRRVANGLVREERRLRWRALSPGHLEIPALVFRARLPGGGREFVAPQAPVRILVRTTLQGHDAARAELPGGILELPAPDGFPWWLVAGLAAVAGLGAVGAVGLARRRKRAAEPPRTPEEQALADLSRLRSQAFDDRGQAAHTALSHVARRYVWDRFGLRAPWMTTTEIASRLETDPRLRLLQELDLAGQLRTCDARRFTGRACDPPDMEEALARFEALVRAATPAQAGSETNGPSRGSGS